MRLLAGVIALLLAWPAFAAGPNISSFTLKNGLEVVVIENHRVPAVNHMLWLRVGGADDPLGKSGLAHFHEHVMFKGTAKHPSGEFDKIITRLGGVQNAFTGYDMTAYHTTLAKEHLATAMELEADRLQGLKPLPAEVLKEREVIIEERKTRIDNQPRAVLAEQVNAAFFVHHPYGTPLIGWKHEMQGLTLEDVQQFHARYYHPNNAVLVLHGDITVADAKPMVEAVYGKLKPAKIPVRNWVTEPPMITQKRLTLTHENVQRPLWWREYLAPSLTAKNAEEVTALVLFAETLGGGDTSVLYQELVMKRKLATSVSASYDGFSLGPSTFTISASPAESVTLEALEQAVEEVIATTLAKGISETDFARNKTLFKADMIFAREGLSGMAYIVGSLRMLNLPVEFLQQWEALVESATPAQGLMVAKKTLAKDHSITATLLPKEIAQ